MSSCRALCSCALTVLIALGGMSAAAQDRSAEPGPLEKRANPITLENPIPRRIYFVMPQNPPELGTTIARAVVTLRITLDESGRVGEARQTCCDLVSQDSARGSDIGAFVRVSLLAVRQWLYDPPAQPPIAFDVTLAFGPGEPQLIRHATTTFPYFGAPPQPRPSVAPDTVTWESGAVRVGGNLKPPLKVRHVAPEYPEDAQEARVQGAVIAEIRIGPDGRVADVRVVRSIPLLDEAAVDAVRQWEFEPTFVGDLAVPVLMTVTVQFTLS